MRKQPLHLHLLFHPGSETAQQLAQSLLLRFVEPPASVGLRIPTFFGPDHGDRLPPPGEGPQSLDLDVAEHSIVVLLADTTMTREVMPNDTGDAWKKFAEELTRGTANSEGRHEFFAAALDNGAFALSDDRNIVPANGKSIEEQVNLISMHISKIAITMLRDGRLNVVDTRGLKAPISIFLSHAKADYKTTPPKNEEEISERPEARWVMDEIGELPVEHWFDSADISPNEKFADKIQQGLRDAAIIVVFLTDHFASRPWCRREVLEAKRSGMSVLVVDALRTGEPRSFPYVGNVPTIRWNHSSSEQENRLQARTVIDRAIRESLRIAYNGKLTQAIANDNELAISTSPELVALTSDPCHEYFQQHRDSPSVVYPDPPLSIEELEVVRRIYPDVKFSTPLSRFVEQKLPESVRRIAVSISNVPKEELRRHGLTEHHYNMMSDELHLYLLLAGAQIGYGGALTGDMTRAGNFTLRLLELVRGYSPLARDAGADLLPVINYAPWPLSNSYSNEDINLLHGVAKFDPGQNPVAVAGFETVFPERTDAKWRLLPDNAEKRFAWGLGLTAMRSRMVEQTFARVITGGRITGSQSAVPGVLEEAWFSLVNNKPLYLVGAFGGMAGAVADLLNGKEITEFTDEYARENVDDFAGVVSLHEERGVPFVSAAKMMADIQSKGRELGVAGALKNGLNDEENQELLRVVDPTRTAELIITGLRNLDDV